MSRDAALEAYFVEAASWDADRAAQAQRRLRIAWSVAGAGWVCAIFVAVALMLLMPLKRVEPYVIRVDSTSGLVDVVPVFVGQADMPEMVTRQLLHHYVSVCERFTHATAERDYEECGAFHTPKRNESWYAQWNRSNPESPLNLYKDGTTVLPQVASISFFTRASGTTDLAQVRYIRVKRRADGSEHERNHWIATIQYAYGEPSKDAKVRRWNQLGFRIIDFRSEPEATTEFARVPTTSAQPSPASPGARR